MIYGGLFDLDNKLKRKDEINIIISSVSFWNSDNRETILKENNMLNEVIDKVMYVKNKIDSNTNILLEELDDEMLSLISMEYEELEKLSYRPGGTNLIANYLQISDAEVAIEFNSGRPLEPEYNFSEEDVHKLLVSGSLDSLLDALDFAP